MNRGNMTILPRLHDGFTLLETIISISIITILASLIIFNFLLFKKRTNVENAMQEFVNVVKLAQSRTLSSESYSKYGVYLDTSVSPQQYTLFKGDSYAARDTGADQLFWLDDTLEFYAINLGGGNEVVFDKLTGNALQSGSISLWVKADTSQNKTVYIASSGVLGFSSPEIASDSNRAKDSRHVHFDYSRTIDSASENIVLTFDGSVNQVIPISSYLSGGKISWEGTVSAGGSDQTIKIHTHQLNAPGTQFSVHRDRMINNKTLAITLSGDTSGNLISYSADGATVQSNSIYVTNLSWQ